MPSNPTGRTFVLLVVISVVFRAVLALVLWALLGHRDIAEDFYDDLARNLVQGSGYVLRPGEPPNLWRAPLYPFFVAGIYWFTGVSDLAVVVAQMLLDGLTVGLVYLIGCRVFDGPTALLGTILVAVYPPTSYYSFRILSESLFTLLLAGTVLGFLRAFATASARDLFLGGLLLGLASLTRSSAQYLWLPVGILWLLHGVSWRRLLRFGLVLLGMALVLAPWTIRNYVVTRQFLLVATGGGYNLWLGNHLPTDGRDTDELPADMARALEGEIARIAGSYGAQFTIENDRRFLREALRAASEQRVETFGLVTRKLWRLWFSIFHPGRRWIEAFVVPIQTLLLAAAGLGAYLALADRRPCLLLLVTILYFVAVHTLTVATLRYSVPILPYLILIGAYGAQRPWRGVRGTIAEARCPY